MSNTDTIEWLRELNPSWPTRRAKYLYTAEARVPLHGDGVVTAFRDGQVTLRSNRRTDGFTIAILEHGYQRIRVGDLVVHSMDAFAGAIGVSESDGKCTPEYVVVNGDSAQVDNRYFAHVLRLMAHRDYIRVICPSVRERAPRFRYPRFQQVVLPIPNVGRQHRIADFLDRKTSIIDALIEKKERLITLLAEKRAALIHETVTKGLDSSVPMKDSGVEWIGSIPAHWEVKRLKFLANVRGGVTKGRKLDKSEVISLPYLRVANVQDGYVDLSVIADIEVLSSEVPKYRLYPGDILMNEGGDNDKLARGCVWQGQISPCLHQNHVFAVRPHVSTNPYWVSQCTSAEYLRFFFLGRANQSTNLASISSTNLKEAPILWPPSDEQGRILVWLDRQLVENSTISIKLAKQTDRLREYRQALITAAVTGQITIP